MTLEFCRYYPVCIFLVILVVIIESYLYKFTENDVVPENKFDIIKSQLHQPESITEVKPFEKSINTQQSTEGFFDSEFGKVKKLVVPNKQLFHEENNELPTTASIPQEVITTTIPKTQPTTSKMITPVSTQKLSEFEKYVKLGNEYVLHLRNFSSLDKKPLPEPRLMLTNDKNDDYRSLIRFYGSKINPHGKYAVVGANNQARLTRNAKYAFNSYFTALAWRASGYGTIAIFGGDSGIWTEVEPWRTVLWHMTQLENVTVVLWPAPPKYSIRISQLGRIFLANLLPDELNNTFLITTDSDFWPLNKDYLNLEKGKEVIVTNPANAANCYTGIFSNSNSHGYMDKSLLRNHILSEMAEKLKGKRVRLKRGAQKRIVVDETLWNNLSSPEQQIYPKNWQNKLNHQEKTFWKYSYIALSSIGAKVKTWKEMMNFIDCPKHRHAKEDIPWTWVKNSGFKQPVNRYQDTDLERQRLMPDQAYIKTYRKYNMTSGCFIRYDDLPQSYDAIQRYLKDSVGPESVDRPTSRGDSNWYLDQKLFSIRLAQWGKRHGYEKIQCVNKTGFDRIQRPSREDWENKINFYQGPLVQSKFRGSHIITQNYELSEWWRLEMLLEKIVSPEELKSAAKYRMDFIKASLAQRYKSHSANFNGTASLPMRYPIPEEIFGKALGGVDPGLIRTDFNPRIFTEKPEKRFFEETNKYLVIKLPDRVYKNEKLETWHVVDKWLGKDQFSGKNLPVFCRTTEVLTEIEKMRKTAWKKVNNFEYPCTRLN